MATDACIGPCCFLGESTAAGTNDYLHILETTLQPPDTYVKLAYEKDSLTVLCLVEAIQISCTSNIRSHSQPFNFSNSPLAMQLLQYQKILPTCPHHTATPHNSSKFSIRFWQEQSLAFFFFCVRTNTIHWNAITSFTLFCSHKLLAHSLSIPHEDCGISYTTTRNSPCPGIVYLKKTSFSLHGQNLQHRTCARLLDALELVRTEHVRCAPLLGLRFRLYTNTVCYRSTP